MDISQNEWQEKLQNDNNSVVLDVRTPAEWLEGIIPEAVTIDIYTGQEFINSLEELDKSKNYYVYCRSGARSAQACSVMKEMGFATAYNLSGGIMQWQGPVVAPLR